MLFPYREIVGIGQHCVLCMLIYIIIVVMFTITLPKRDYLNREITYETSIFRLAYSRKTSNYF